MPNIIKHFMITALETQMHSKVDFTASCYPNIQSYFNKEIYTNLLMAINGLMKKQLNIIMHL